MSLATRCTACGTVFRVVQDQLKVSDGWVRCGRCDAVFNAAESLFDLDRETPPAWSPTQPPAEAPRAPFEPALDARPRAHDRIDVDAPRSFSADGAAFRDDAPAALGVVEIATPAPPGVPADLISTALARHAGAEADRAASLGLGDDPVSVRDGDETPSSFAWRPDAAPNRRGRTWLASAAVLLVAVLLAQAAARFSEVAAARWPVLRPVLTGWCGVAGCSLAAPRRIEDIVVDSSALAPVIGTDALKLGISLRNRARFAVAVPSVDLSLTDSAGRLIARRTLQPTDFRVAAAALGPGSELPLQALVTAGTATVTGYTVEIFYP